MQTYLKNGYIVSMDQQDTVFDGGGVLVEDDRITAVGKVDPRLVKPDAEVIDLQGRYVLPGFVNTHVHTSQQISRGVGDDVDFICWLHDRMWPFESSMTEEDSYVSTLMTSLELIRSGVTSFAEPGGQFVSGMARGLGIPDRVTSPTFTIVNEYEGGRLPLFHFDMYRLGSSDELFDIGWEDYLARGGVCAVEWSENVDDALDDDAIRVDIRRGAQDDQRVISVTGGPDLTAEA